MLGMIGLKFPKHFFQGNLTERAFASPYVLKMIRYVKNHERLGFPLKKDLAADLVQQPFSKSFIKLFLNFNMNNMEKNSTRATRHVVEQNLKSKGRPFSWSIMERNGTKGPTSKVVKGKERKFLGPKLLLVL